jgi:hypothetical protein
MICNGNYAAYVKLNSPHRFRPRSDSVVLSCVYPNMFLMAGDLMLDFVSVAV